MLDISKLSGNSYIPGVGETVYAIRRKKRRNSAADGFSARCTRMWRLSRSLWTKSRSSVPSGQRNLAWKGAGYPPLSPDDTFYGQVRICKANVASTQEEAEALLAKFKKTGLSFNVDDVVEESGDAV